MKTAYSYVRFSTPEQEMGDSERRLIALATSYCAKNGLRLSETAFADRGYPPSTASTGRMARWAGF